MNAMLTSGEFSKAKVIAPNTDYVILMNLLGLSILALRALSGGLLN